MSKKNQEPVGKYLHGLWENAVRLQRKSEMDLMLAHQSAADAQSAMAKYNAELSKALMEAKATPGFTYDIHNDYKLKPAKECTRPDKQGVYGDLPQQTPQVPVQK